MQVMFSIPLYFQTSANASVMVAGAHLFPAVVGNAIGSLLVGIIIKRYISSCFFPFDCNFDKNGSI